MPQVKKSYDRAVASAGIIDPLEDFDIEIQSFDIPRLLTVYPDRAGLRWWAKAWFNNSENGEPAVEIETQTAIQFILDRADKEAMLQEYFPRQMEIYHNAIEQAKEQLLKQMTVS